MCLTSVEALASSPCTRSTCSSRSLRMYCLATFCTHGGSVAEKSSTCLSASPPPAPMASHTFWMSSLKPMSSIWSASSSTRNRRLPSLSVPRSMWSSTRPGVPTTTCTPRLSASS